MSVLPQSGSRLFKTFESEVHEEEDTTEALSPLQRIRASPWFPHGILLCCQVNAVALSPNNSWQAPLRHLTA